MIPRIRADVIFRQRCSYQYSEFLFTYEHQKKC
jgi:hypothetical protein